MIADFRVKEIYDILEAIIRVEFMRGYFESIYIQDGVCFIYNVRKHGSVYLINNFLSY